jgi:toxin ParE1/3/4
MLILRKKAEEDIKLAYEWYEAQKNHLGKAFVKEVEKKFLEIEEHPELYLLVMGRVRRALCKKFPYSIYFLNNGADIVVIGVLHQRRNPELWQTRQ